MKDGVNGNWSVNESRTENERLKKKETLTVNGNWAVNESWTVNET